MKIGLLGYGVVGGGVFELCAMQEHFDIVSVLCLDPHIVPDNKGVSSAQDMLNDPTVDTIVEVMGGLHPAYELVSAAMNAGKNVVTANKHLVCQYYKELTELAAKNGVSFRCTAAVGGGIPWLVNLERARRCDTIRKVSGILNGTTNYILDTMHHSPVPFAEVLASAQRLGYAEADPSADIDGLDIRRKLAISANIAFDTSIPEETIPTWGIRGITADDIAAFQSHGYTCKLLASAGLNADDSLYILVEPCLLGPDWPEASVPSNYNLISMEGDAIGKESFFGQGAGRLPTAYNVVQDLVDIHNGVRNFYTTACQERPVDNTLLRHRYYVRSTAEDSWLKNHTETTWPEGGVITTPVSPVEMHTAGRCMAQTDSGTFFAALL